MVLSLTSSNKHLTREENIYFASWHFIEADLICFEEFGEFLEKWAIYKEFKEYW